MFMSVTSGHSQKLMIPLTFLDGFDVEKSTESHSHAQFYNYNAARPNEFKYFWLGNDYEVIEYENDYLKLNTVATFYHKKQDDNLFLYTFVIIRNKLVFITDSKEMVIILPKVKCLNRDCYEYNCVVLWNTFMFCGICGMEHELDSLGSILKKQDIEAQSYSKAKVFVGK